MDTEQKEMTFSFTLSLWKEEEDMKNQTERTSITGDQSDSDFQHPGHEKSVDDDASASSMLKSVSIPISKWGKVYPKP